MLLLQERCFCRMKTREFSRNQSSIQAPDDSPSLQKSNLSFRKARIVSLIQGRLFFVICPLPQRTNASERMQARSFAAIRIGRRVFSLAASSMCLRPIISKFTYQSPRAFVDDGGESFKGIFIRLDNLAVIRKHTNGYSSCRNIESSKAPEALSSTASNRFCLFALFS